jgi:hypothetical protein
MNRASLGVKAPAILKLLILWAPDRAAQLINIIHRNERGSDNEHLYSTNGSDAVC